MNINLLDNSDEDDSQISSQIYSGFQQIQDLVGLKGGNNKITIEPDQVVCSSSLRDTVSFYSQFKLCQGFQELQDEEQKSKYNQKCGNINTIKASTQEKFISIGQKENQVPSENFRKMTRAPLGSLEVCQYQIYNPYPNQTLYLSLYRYTNATQVGLYYLKNGDDDDKTTNIDTNSESLIQNDLTESGNSK